MKFPVSLWFFVVCAVELFLQMLPMPGILLMFLMAGLWSVVLINLGFAGLGYEAFVRRISRWWLLAPALWFVGYPAYVTIDNARQEVIAKEFAAQNSKIHINFDPNSMDLNGMVDWDFEIAKPGPALLQFYDLPSFYSELNGKILLGKGKPPTTSRISFVANQQLCDSIQNRDDARRSQIRTSTMMAVDNTTSPMRLMKPIRTACIASLYENSDRPKVTILINANGSQKLESDHSKDELQVIGPDGIRHSLSIGQFRTHFWFPLPVMGCWLNSGGKNEGWKCDGGFLGTKLIPIPTYNIDESYVADILAPALGLTRIEGSPIPVLTDDAAQAKIEQSIKQYEVPIFVPKPKIIKPPEHPIAVDPKLRIFDKQNNVYIDLAQWGIRGLP